MTDSTLLRAIMQDLPEELGVYSDVICDVFSRKMDAYIAQKGYVSPDELEAISKKLQSLSDRILELENLANRD